MHRATVGDVRHVGITLFRLGIAIGVVSNVGFRAFVVGMLTLQHRPRRLEALLAIPANRIGFQRRHHLGQCLPQRSHGRPVKQVAGARDVECVVVVGAVDHPRFDESFLAGDLILQPGAELGHRCRNAVRFVRLTADQPHECVLQFVVAQRLGLTDQDRSLRRQLGAAINGALDGINYILKMDVGLPMRDFTGIQTSGKLSLVDALDLMRQRRRMAEIVVDARHAQDGRRYVAALGVDDLFGADLRLRVSPGRTQGPVLVNELARFDRPVHQHRTGENELFDVEPVAQSAQQTPGALDCDLFVLGTRLAEKIVVGSQMHD